MPERAVTPEDRGRLGLPADGPGDFTFADVSGWVIWQYPLLRKGWWCGAAHPPLRGFGWLPILVHPDQRAIRVHPAAVFPTPEAAADWMAARRAAVR